MNIEQFLARFRWFFFREGFLYVLILTVALRWVDVPGIVGSIKTRRLNDMATGINMSQLVDFSKGGMDSSTVDWEGVSTYFRTIQEFFPSSEDAEMFLGYCEYYGLGQEKNAFEHIRRSADNMPYLFWNVYDTGLILFKIGDMQHASLYLQLALLVPGNGMLYTMGNSMIYRQFFAKTFGPGLELRVNHARENAVLLLAASFYYQQDYEKAKLFAMKGVTEPGISDREPFYFYAGAIAMAQGNSYEALSFFRRAMEANSLNPLVYRYTADTLRKIGRVKEAQMISKWGQPLDQRNPSDQFPYPSRLQLEVY